MIHFSEVDEEVLYTTESVTTLNKADIDYLKSRSSANKRKRIRLCAHPDVNDHLHEMLIVHQAGNYIPPHKHPGKSESFHMVEGLLKIVLFDDDGTIADIIKLDSKGKDGSFYYRLSKSMYHTVIPESDIVVFHEVTNGPFRREDLVIPKWAPDDTACNDSILCYMSDLAKRMSVLGGCKEKIKGQSILVVGADGHIGRALSSELQLLGADLFETTRRHDSIGKQRVYLDLSMPIAKLELPKPMQISFVSAGATSLLDCERDPGGTARINVDHTLSLIRQLLDAGSTVVYLSTGIVTGGRVPFTLQDAEYQPSCEYARQKVEVERALMKWNDENVVILRMTKVLSSEMPLIKEWIRNLKNGVAIHPFSDLVMAPISLSYLTNALFQVVASKARGIFQVTGNRDISYADAATFIAKKLGVDEGLVQPVTSKEVGFELISCPKHTTLDSKRVETEFGIKPANVWNSIIEAFSLWK